MTVGPALHRLRRAVRQHLEGVTGLVVVACSGGPDSLALAAATAATGRAAGALVVDHGLQGESAAVAARAAQQCRSLGLDPVVVLRAHVGSQSGPEAAARAARYEVLTAAAARLGAAAILLAHTQDDQAETVLLGLARGSGTRSLAGMAPVRGVLRRPLLSIPRAEVHAALAETGLEPWADPHNRDLAQRRARVRATVLPLLEAELGPGVAAALARTAELARADADALDEEAAHARRELDAAGWPVEELRELPRAVRTRVLLAAAREAGCAPGDLTAAHVAEVDRLITDWHGQGPLPLPGRVNVGRQCGRLYFAGESITIGVPDGA